MSEFQATGAHRVWKCDLTGDLTELEFPPGYIVHANFDPRGKLSAWVLVRDPEREPITRHVLIRVTGDPLPGEGTWSYLNTFAREKVRVPRVCGVAAVTADIDRLLDAMQARCAAATDGPWWWDERGDLRPTPHDEYGLDSLINWDAIYEAPVLASADREFIAAARADLPRLVAAVRAVLEMHPGVRHCGNPRHTNPEVGCPGCAFICAACGDVQPCRTVTALTTALEES